MPQNIIDNPWLGFLEENYPALFGASLPNMPGNNAYNYWRQQAGRLNDLYQSELGKMALGGQAPSMTQTQFITSFPFLQQWKKMAPWARGEQTPMRSFWNVPTA